MERYIFKMEPEDFIRKVIELYREARMPSFYHPKLKRGQSRVIYNLTEDLMAYFLAVNLTEDYEFYIDQPITFEGFGKSSKRPDVTLSKNGEVKNIIDIKTDLGRKRTELTKICKDNNEFIEEIKGKIGRIRVLQDDGQTKRQEELKILENLVYHIVIITSENINKEMLKEHIQNIKNLNLEHIELYFLTSGYHPNEYKMSVEENLSKININKEEFVRLMDNLTK